MRTINIKNSRNKTLVGDLYSVESDKILIMSHGFFADRTHGGTIKEIVKPLNDIGINVLSYDSSGCGESENDRLTLDKLVDDLKSIINFVKNKGYKKIYLLGFSLGGLVSLKCFDKDISTMVLCAPLTHNPHYNWKKKFGDQMEKLDEVEYLVKECKFGPRKEIIIDKQLIKDFKDIKMEEVLENITCPILIIHGIEDTNISVEDSKKATKFLSKESKLELIEDCGHFFSEDNLNKMIILTKDWLIKQIKKH